MSRFVTQKFLAAIPAYHRWNSLRGCELLKKLTVLVTIYWISRARNSVDASTIIQCFNNWGFDKIRQTPPVETDDDSDYDDVPIIELVRRYAEEVYGTDIQKVISADVPTCDNHNVEWDASIKEIMDWWQKVMCMVDEASDFVKKWSLHQKTKQRAFWRPWIGIKWWLFM